MTENVVQPENVTPLDQSPVYYNNRFHIDNDFGPLLPLSLPWSLSLGLALMDISEPESDQLNLEDTTKEQTDEEFINIDILVPDIIPDDQSVVRRLVVRLTDQLLQFQGYCHDCYG